VDLRSEIPYFDKEEKEKWINEFVEKEIAAARQRVAEAEVAIDCEGERAEDMELSTLAGGPKKISFQ
jgi:hypothetical protein